MIENYSFEDVRKLLENDLSEDTKLLDAFDTYSGISLIIAPIVTGTLESFTIALSLVKVKNELTKAGKYILSKLASSKNSETPLDRCQRLQMAYTITCHVSICEAASDAYYEIRELLNLEAKDMFVFQAEQKENMYEESSSIKYPFPQPTDDLYTIIEFLDQVTVDSIKLLENLVQSTKQWSDAATPTKEQISDIFTNLPKKVNTYFRANLIEFAVNFPDFHIWIYLFRDESIHDQLKKTTNTLTDALVVYSESKDNIDIGLERLSLIIRSVHKSISNDSADIIITALQKRYDAKLDEPIVRRSSSSGLSGLTFPKIREIFIPQSFKSVRYHNNIPIELESMWKKVKSYDELGPYLLHTLQSPYSFDLPLVILGNPGSGKSLLSEVLAGQLLGEKMFPIRIPLRDINADIDIQAQIEEWVQKYTGESCLWPDLSRRLNEIGRPPLVILDGYDELLQASGLVFSNYIIQVNRFLEREKELGRGARAIVTSRVALIGRANIPENTIILRLDPFDKKKQQQWINIWNKANNLQFKKKGINEFQVLNPESKIAELGSQPLLLLMLAIYDSDGNVITLSETLDQTALYNDLIRNFIQREKTKGESADHFNALSLDEQLIEVEHDLDRLGVSAIGMFNRNSVVINSAELNEDICFFKKDAPFIDKPGAQLEEAEKLLGSFFFVHKSQKSNDDKSFTFEFLHNTFGEYLTADFILRRIFNEIEDILEEISTPRKNRRSQLEQRLERANAFSVEWYACLAHTHLHSRPLVLEMLQEWSKHELDRRKLSAEDVIRGLDIILKNQLERLLNNFTPPEMFSPERPTPYPKLSFVGHLAIYSLNLILLRITLVNDEYNFAQFDVGSTTNGTSIWEQLTFLWRSWFSIYNLASLTTIFYTKFEDGIPILKQGRHFEHLPPTDSELHKYLAITLGDDVTRVLAVSCSENNDPEGWPALQAAIKRTGMALTLTNLVNTIAKYGNLVPMELIKKTAEQVLTNPDKEKRAQQRLHYLAELNGFEHNLFKAMYDFYGKTDMFTIGYAPLVIGLALWCIENETKEGPTLLLAVFKQHTNIREIGRALRHARLRMGEQSGGYNLNLRVFNSHITQERELDSSHLLKTMPPGATIEYLRVSHALGSKRVSNDYWPRTLRLAFEKGHHDMSHETAIEFFRFAIEINAIEWIFTDWKQYCSLHQDILKTMPQDIILAYLRLELQQGYISETDTQLTLNFLDTNKKTQPHFAQSTVLAYIKLAHELGQNDWAIQMWKQYFQKDPQSLKRLLPDNILECIRVVIQLGNRTLIKNTWTQAIRKEPTKLRELSPELALEHMRMASKSGDYDWANDAWHNFFQRDRSIILNLRLETLISYVSLGIEMGDEEWVRNVWLDYLKIDPRKFSSLSCDNLFDLLSIVQFIGDIDWITGAIGLWKKESASFKKIIDNKELLALLIKINISD